MKKKINFRFIGIALLAILVTLFGVTSIYYHLFQKQVKTDLQTVAETLADSGVFDKKNIEDLNFTTQKIRITWVDETGIVIYDNWAVASELENHSNRSEIQEALKNGRGESIRDSKTIEENTYYYAILLKDYTVLRVSMNADNSMSIFIKSLPFIGIIIGGILLLCVVLADYLTKRILSPILKMADGLQDSKEGARDDDVYKELRPFVATIREQHENILASAKMRQDFTASVSHELKTPLTAISGYAELIENQMITPEQEIKFAGEIRKNSHRLLTLINDIIQLSEYDNPNDGINMESIDLYEVAQECVKDLTINASKRGVTLTLSGSSSTICGNQQMLRELIENLCENAIRYNKDGGRVHVFVGMENEKTILVVGDTGIGIPKEHQERVFERFYRVDKSRSRETGGTGLGLAIVKHIVAIHDATIKLESEVGIGTKVTVEF